MSEGSSQTELGGEGLGKEAGRSWSWRRNKPGPPDGRRRGA